MTVLRTPNNAGRRTFLSRGAAFVLIAPMWPLRAGAQAQPADAMHRRFIAAAEEMRIAAVRAGDQSYGAVVVRDGEIIGWGPSRVVTDRNPDAHAERVAIWDAQKRLGRKDLSGAVLYSTSRACSLCEKAAAQAQLSRMYWGAKGIDAGVPRG